MEFKDVTDVTLKLIDKIDNLWNFFFVSNFGLALWIFSNSNLINIYLAIIGTLAYLAFSTVQCLALIRGYIFLNYAITELKLSIDDNGLKSEKLKIGLKKLNYKSRITIVVISYFIAISIILLLLWTDTNYNF